MEKCLVGHGGFCSMSEEFFMRKIGTAALLVFSCLAGPSLAAGKDYTVVVQDYEALPPYSSYTNGDYQGFNRELLDMFAASKDYNFEYVALPVKRLFFEFVNGTGDLKYPDNPKWQEKIKANVEVVYSDPVVEYIDGVMVLPANKGRSVDEMKTLGVVAGWTPWVYLDRSKSGQIELLENSSYEGLLKQAMFGRNDGAYSNIASSQYYLKNILNAPQALVFDDTLPHVRSSRRLSSIKHPELIEEFNAFLTENVEDVQALKDKYAVEDGIKEN
jgi:hypothetical protein